MRSGSYALVAFLNGQISSRMRPAGEQVINRKIVALLLPTVFGMTYAVTAYSPVEAETCPLTIKSLTLAGKGAAGKAVMYALTADILGPTPMSAALTMRTRSGDTLLNWPRIEPSANAPKPSSPQQEVRLLFERKSDDILGVKIATASGVPCTASATAASKAADHFPVVTVYDELAHHEALPEGSPLDRRPLITDAKFLHKLAPVYPQIFQDQNRSGTVEVGINIGSDGVPLYAWIRARDTSLNSDTSLDGPSIWAALHSTYSPQLSEGRPTTSTYLILYSYRLDNQNLSASHIDHFKLCPLVLQEYRVAVSDESDHTQWYSFSVDSLDSKGVGRPTSAVIGVRNAKHTISGLLWNPVPLQQVVNKPDAWFANGSFNWNGPPLVSAWVDSVVMNNGKTINCQPVIDPPFNLADSTEFPRYISGDQLPMLSIQQVLPAQFIHEVWPEFPPGPSGVRLPGFTVVQSVVDDAGVVREAFVIQTSGVSALDLAALNAASSSTYNAASSGAVAMYEAVYQFVP